MAKKKTVSKIDQLAQEIVQEYKTEEELFGKDGDQLNTNNHLVQWTLSVYFIGFALGVFFWGRLSDRIGRRKSMLLGLIIYTISSLLCLSSQNIILLLMYRLLQGFGASCGSVLTQAIAREALNDQLRHRFFSAAGFVIAFSIALGPFLGGYLTQFFSWRANFTLLTMIGISLYCSVFLCLPETLQVHASNSKSSIRKIGLTMIRDKRVLGFIWLVAVVNGFLFSYYAEAPFLFIKLVGLTPSQYGWLGAFIAIAALSGSIASKKIVHLFDKKRILVLGGILMFLSSFFLVTFASGNVIGSDHKLASLAMILVPVMLIVFSGFGFIVPISLGEALLDYKAVLGTAGAIFGLSYYFLVAFITLGMGLFHSGTLMSMAIYFFSLSVITIAVIYASHYKRLESIDKQNTGVSP